MLPRFCKSVVTVISPAKTDERGTIITDWENATRTEVGGCSFQISSTNSERDGRANTQTTAILYMPPTANICAGDRVEYRGMVYEVEGQPMFMESPTGRFDHLRVNLIDWRG